MTDRPGYLDGPHASLFADMESCYKYDDSEAILMTAANLATVIDYWLCGPDDDGDESQDWFLMRAVERAGRYIYSQPCTCTEDICDRCRAIGSEGNAHD